MSSSAPARRSTTVAAAVLTALAVAACTPSDGPIVEIDESADSRAGSTLHGTEIGNVIKRPALALPTTGGATFDLQQRPGNEVTAIFFGYTRCPDVCPTTMADLAAAHRQLPQEAAERVQVAFITEDPRRDTPAVLEAWLRKFEPSFLGLRGGNADTVRALDALKATRTEVTAPRSSSVPHPTDGTHSGHTHTNGAGETVEHTGSVYVFARDRVVVYTGGTTPKQYAADFLQLLSS